MRCGLRMHSSTHWACWTAPFSENACSTIILMLVLSFSSTSTTILKQHCQTWASFLHHFTHNYPLHHTHDRNILIKGLHGNLADNQHECMEVQQLATCKTEQCASRTCVLGFCCLLMAICCSFAWHEGAVRKAALHNRKYGCRLCVLYQIESTWEYEQCFFYKGAWL